MDRMYVIVILHGQGSNHAQRMRAERCDRLDVGLDAGAAARVCAGENQHAGSRHVGHRTLPAIGDDGDAAKRFGILPARKAVRPASTASRIARAICTGSRAPAIAVFISTPSQPSSIAIAASDAVPTPASTSTGTVACSIISDRFHGFKIPMPEPIREASGITATQPICSNIFAWIGSSLQYTITSKPSLTR